MISIRQVVVVVLVAVGLWLFRRLQTKLTAGRTQPKTETDFQDMVRCERCGTHIARSQALGNSRHGFRCKEGDCLGQTETN